MAIRKKLEPDLEPTPELVPAPEPPVTTAATLPPHIPPEAFCVYIGPSIRGLIQSGTIYPDTIAAARAALAPAIARYPLIAELIVSDAALPVERLRVRQPGNLLNQYFNELSKGVKSHG